MELIQLIKKELFRNKFVKKKKKKRKKLVSPSGNRTPVSRVTGGDTYHYTNEDLTDEAAAEVSTKHRNADSGSAWPGGCRVLRFCLPH